MAHRNGSAKGDRIYSDMGKVNTDWNKRYGTYTAPEDCEKLKRRAAGTERVLGRPFTSHCKRGHPRTKENTYTKASKRRPGGVTRDCKPCALGVR